MEDFPSGDEHGDSLPPTGIPYGAFAAIARVLGLENELRDMAEEIVKEQDAEFEAAMGEILGPDPPSPEAPGPSD